MKYPQGRPTYFGNLSATPQSETATFEEIKAAIGLDCASDAAYAVLGRLGDCAIAMSIFETRPLREDNFVYRLHPVQDNLREILMQGKAPLQHLTARICVKLDPATGELIGVYAVRLDIHDN